MSERCERMTKWRSEWPNTLRVDFIVILPNVQRSKNTKLLPHPNEVSREETSERLGGSVVPTVLELES